jgi:serine/threonine protein kinase
LCRFGFPELISFKESDDHAEMLLEALGFNLRQVILELPTSNFSKASCYKIMLQLIDLIEKSHSVKLVHNDLKLENIVVGVRDPSQLHLIDFGLTQSLVDKNGKHI